ncbi:MAG: hypothetical protein HUU29_06440, partial [Planctomycetaceae bacterium]|nr:hypothetical protein [Planctomycetaceae bacterium]
MKTQAPLSRFIPCYLSNCGGGDERNESLVAALPYSDETKVAVLDQNGVPLACHYRSQVIGWLANTPWAITWLNGTVTALDTIGELEKQWKASPDNVDLARKLAEVARTLGRCDLACECYDALDRIAKMPANAETVEALGQRLEAMIDADLVLYYRKRNWSALPPEIMTVSEKTFQFFTTCLEQLIDAKDKAAACHFATQGRLIVGWWCPDVSAGLALVERLIAAFPATTALEGD